MSPGPLEIKKKSYLIDAPPSDMPTNTVKLYQPRLLTNTTYMPCIELLCPCSWIIYACCPSVTVRNTAAVQTCLLIECCCKMDACWTVATQSACLLLSLNIACLLVLCFSICYTCWYGVSLSALLAGMVSHYQPCLLVWYFIIGHAFWFASSLSAMHVGVVPHYRSCLLLWCLTICHACWRGTSLKAMPADPCCTSTNI